MITVRFPNGQAIAYNTANYVYPEKEYTDLYRGDKNKRGIWLVQVPNSCLIEGTTPCRVSNAPQEQSLESLTKEVRALRRNMEKKKR